MRLKWIETKSSQFSEPILTAERNGEWIFWAVLIVVSLSGLVYLILR